jgi:hypothetical protein
MKFFERKKNNGGTCPFTYLPPCQHNGKNLKTKLKISRSSHFKKMVTTSTNKTFKPKIWENIYRIKLVAERSNPIFGGFKNPLFPLGNIFLSFNV